jgi:hypothetical protein
MPISGLESQLRNDLFIVDDYAEIIYTFFPEVHMIIHYLGQDLQKLTVLYTPELSFDSSEELSQVPNYIEILNSRNNDQGVPIHIEHEPVSFLKFCYNYGFESGMCILKSKIRTPVFQEYTHRVNTQVKELLLDAHNFSKIYANYGMRLGKEVLSESINVCFVVPKVEPELKTIVPKFESVMRKKYPELPFSVHLVIPYQK